MEYGQYGLNLTKAIQGIARNPSPMTTESGRLVPAVYYSEKFEACIQWLVDRYNDGTLKVEGYRTTDTGNRSRILTMKKRREEILDIKGYMLKSDFIRETGFSEKRVDRIAKQAGAYCREGEGRTASVHINVNRFFHYLDTLATQQDYETFVGIEEASQLTGFSIEEIKKKIDSGEFKAKKKSNRKYNIYRTSLYKDPNMIPKPMAIEKGVKKYDGKDVDSSKQVHRKRK